MLAATRIQSRARAPRSRNARRAVFFWSRHSPRGRGRRRPDLEPANLRRLAAGTWRGEAGIAVVHIAIVNAHAVRIGIGRPRNRDDLENLARLRIDLLHDVVARNQYPQRAVVPIEPMRAVTFRGTDAQRTKILRIDFRYSPDAERHHPERLRLRHECDPVDAAAPDQWMDLDRLAGLEIRLNHFSVGLVSWTRRAPSADAAVGAEPHVAGADREAARVVRFGLHLVQHLAGLPVDFEDALRHLIADPQAVGRRFERVRMEIGRLEQPLDLRRPRRNRPR